MIAEPARKLATIEDWLAHEGEPDQRYELVGGALVAMAQKDVKKLIAPG